MRSDPEPHGRPTRRDFLTLGVGAFVVASLPLALALRGRRSSRRLVRRTVPVMGTIADLAVVSDDDARGRAALDDAVQALRQVDLSMSRFRADSDVGRVNALAGRDAATVGADTAYVLERAVAFATATDGIFDPCLGGAAALWDVGQRTVPPDAGAQRAYAGRDLWRSLEIETARGMFTVHLGDTSARIDLGGIAKGFGVDAAARALREHGIEDGLVNVGGDLVCLGRSVDGDPWRVGIRAPDDPGNFLDTLEVEDEAVATSGDYEHGFWHGGCRYHHLLDPRTAGPGAEGARSVTVRAPTCLDADAMATAAFLLPAGGEPSAVAPGARVVRRI